MYRIGKKGILISKKDNDINITTIERIHADSTYRIMSIYTIGNRTIYNIIIYGIAARLCRGEKIAGGMLAGEGYNREGRQPGK